MTFDMIGQLDPCALVAYRAPADALQKLLPPGLELIRHNHFAFLGVVISRVVRMRPAHFPKFLGVTYAHVAYRLYVRAHLADGRTLDGIHFLRSDVDSRLMSLGGNIMTDFRFHPAQITLAADANQLNLAVQSSDARGDAMLSLSNDVTDFDPAQSCFANSAQAAEFLKYRPLGLSCSAAGSKLKIAQVLRDESKWVETPARVIDAKWSFLDSLGINFSLERVTRVAPIDYRWRLGASERIAASSAR